MVELILRKPIKISNVINALILHAPTIIKICRLKIFVLPRIPRLYPLLVQTFNTGMNFYLFKAYYKNITAQTTCAK